MTVYCVMAVFDSAAQGYAMPFCAPSRGVAVRTFTDEVNRADKDNVLYQHPDDYELRHLAMWDSDSGLYTASADVFVCRGKDVRVMEGLRAVS